MFGAIVGAVNELTGLMNGISQTARNQAQDVSTINGEIGGIGEMAHQNAALVEETNAASHTLAQDAENLTRLVGQFQIHEGVRASVGSPRAVPTASRPAPSPARNLVSKVAGAFSSSAAVRGNAQAAAENWEEF